MASDFSDKARWDQAATGVYVGTMRGARAAETEAPDMMLTEVTIEWSEQPIFDVQGNAYADTKEPGTLPVKTTVRYTRKPDLPTL